MDFGSKELGVKTLLMSFGANIGFQNVGRIVMQRC